MELNLIKQEKEMKKLLLTIMLMVPLVAVADDQSIMFEFGVGFGKSSGGRDDGTSLLNSVRIAIMVDCTWVQCVTVIMKVKCT